MVGLEWYPCCRLKEPARCVLEFRCGWVGVVFVLQAEGTCKMCVGVSVWLGWSGIRVAG